MAPLAPWLLVHAVAAVTNALVRQWARWAVGAGGVCYQSTACAVVLWWPLIKLRWLCKAVVNVARLVLWKA